MLSRFAPFFLCFNLLCILYNVRAQDISCDNALWDQFKNFSSGEELYAKIASDFNNNVYVAGYFNEYADFGDTVLIAPGKASYLMKYNESGDFIWGKVVEENTKIAQIAISGDNLYLLSSYPNNSERALWSIGKYNLDGGQNWIKFPKNFVDGFSFQLSTDSEGNAYVAGSFYDFVQISEEVFTAENKFGDGFLVKYSPKGELQWTRQLPYATIYDLAVNSKGDVYAAGTFENTITFAGDSIHLYKSAYWGAIYFKFSSNGEEQLANYVSRSAHYSILNAIAIDAEDNVVVGGYFESTNASLDDTTTSIIGPHRYALNHSMLVKYGMDGSFLWSTKIESGSQGAVEALTFDDDSNIYLGANTLETQEVMKFNSKGVKVWNIPINHIEPFYACFGLVLNKDKKTVNVIGNYNKPIQFDDVTITPSHKGDVYLSKLNLSSILSAPLQASTNVQITDLTGTSVHASWENGDGTKRLVLLKKQGAVIPHNIKDGQVYDQGEETFGKGTKTGDNEFVVYSGTANETTITGLEPGSPYQLAVIEYNESTCAHTTNYLQEKAEKNTFITLGNLPEFSAYPNPLTGSVLAVQLPTNNPEATSLTLTDVYGKQLIERKVKSISEANGVVKIDVADLNLPAGVYYLNLPGQSPIRLIKK